MTIGGPRTTEEQVISLLEAWDELDSASQRVECASPQAMTNAILHLTHQRVTFRAILQRLARMSGAMASLGEAEDT